MIKFPKSSNGSTFKLGGLQSQSIPNSIGSGKYTLPSGKIKKIDLKTDSLTYKTIENLVDASKKTETDTVSEFEKLTNISSKRPEVISLLHFQPLLNDFGENTPEGELFEIFIRTMKRLDKVFASRITQDIESNILSADFIKSSNEKFQSEVTEIRRVLQAIYGVYRKFANIRKFFTITGDEYDYNPTKFISKNFSNNLLNVGRLNQYASELPSNLNIKSTIELLRGPSSDKLINQYCTTKLWVMLLAECRLLHTHHSYRLLKQSDIAKNDVSTGSDSGIAAALSELKTISTIPQYQTKRFSFSNTAINNLPFNDTTLNAFGDYDPSGESNPPLITSLETVNSFESALRNELSILGEMSRITAIFHCVTREIILSNKYNASKLGIFKSGLTAFSNQKLPMNIARSVFGMKQGNVWFQGIDEGDKNSLLGLAYQQNLDTTDTSAKVLMLEQKKQPGFSTSFESGGEYFFENPELLIQFSNQKYTNQNSGPDVAFKARVNSLYDTVNRYDEDFFKFLSEISGLSMNDSTFFDKSKPKFFSTDSAKFFENVWNPIKNLIPTQEILGLKNQQLGIESILSFCGNDNAESRSIKNLIFLIILSYTNDSSLTNLDVISQTFSSQFSKIQNSTSEFVETISNTYFYSFVEDLLHGEEVYDKLSDIENKIISKFDETGFYVCQYPSHKDFVSTLVNNKIVKKIVDILKDIKRTFLEYAAFGSKSLYSEIDINSILYCIYIAICKLINNSTGLNVVGVKKDSILGYDYNPQDVSNAIGDTPSEVGDASNTRYVGAELGLFASVENLAYELNIFVTARAPIGKDFSGLIPTDLAYNAVKKQLAEENKLLLAGLSTVGNIISTLKQKIQEVKNLSDKLDVKDYQKLIEYLGDSNKLKFFLKEPQMTLALSNFEDMYQNFQNFSTVESLENSDTLFTNYYSGLPRSDKMIELLKNFLKDSEFRSTKGYNKKIISVGLAQDLLKNTLPYEDSGKENDIIRLSIYKIDLLNSNIIYKPKSYLFEASRYPVRVYSELRKDITDLSAVPTRNYSFSPTVKLSNSGVGSYWNETSNNFDSEYSFLRDEEKIEILENHAVSFLLENYIKILTGMHVEESAFNLTADESEALLQNFQLNFGVQSQNLKNADSSTHIKFLIQPKKFDRIFHMIFDPEFEVDEQKTMQLMNNIPTYLEDLVQIGKLNKVFYKNSADGAFSFAQKYVDRDKGSSDISLETFFVVMESYTKESSSNSKFYKIPNELLGQISSPIKLSPFESAIDNPIGQGLTKKTLSSISNILKKLGI